jgi:molecular chaperone HtpG
MSVSIRYPSRFAKKLRANHELSVAVDETISDFSAWLSDSKVTFFPDYTDHGPDHISAVLTTASELISRPAWGVVSAADLAVLILAVLLHDAALHLSEDGVRELILGRWSDRRIDGLDTTSWPELWQEFLFTARRWDSSKRREVLGDARADLLLDSYPDPLEQVGHLTQTDIGLIGEFIRQHHPRLAHEFAVYGVPGPGNHSIRPSDRFGPKKVDLAGLIARSHGSALRDFLPFLKDRFDRREYQSVHAVFLMALLRIADYIQLQPERAPVVVSRYKRIASLRSQFEHSVHSTMTNITDTHDDPEAIRIDAEPDDVRTFIHLKALLGGLQKELDSSWAVIGEVYGAHQRLRRLGMRLRRVYSNLDNFQSLAERLPFYPARIEFTLAHAEILEHFIGPLYGDRPEIGIRELLQNAIDAVRELEAWLYRHPEERSIQRLEQEGDVEIWLCQDEEGNTFVKISDRGIGMTEVVVRDYFLRVGASYRNSPAWQREFAKDPPGSPGQVQVLRSGRFGIGVLAAFLLGKEIVVSTRHVTADHGFTFRTSPTIGPVELRRATNLAVGTTITIPLRSIHLGDTDWDWYCFEYPRVLRFKGRDRTRLEQETTLPDSRESLPLGWYAIDAPDFAGVFVGPSQSTAPNERRLKRSHLVCNGIAIRGRFGSRDRFFGSGRGLRDLNLAEPSVVVLDPDGRLPLDLSRRSLAATPPFAEEIERVVCESILAGVLVNLPGKAPLGGELDYLLPRFDRPFEAMVSFSPWLLTSKGVALATAWSVREMGADAVLVTFTEGLTLMHEHLAVLEGQFIYGEDNELETLLLAGILDPLEVSGARFLVTASYANHLVEFTKKSSSLFNFKVHLEWTNGVWSLVTYGVCPGTRLDRERLPQPGRRSGTWPVAVEWFFGKRERKAPRHRQFALAPQGLSRVWKEIVRQPVIPFDLEERKAKLGSAYELLQKYFAEHQAINSHRSGGPARRSRRSRRGTVAGAGPASTAGD